GRIDAARGALAEVIERIRRRVGYERFLALPDLDDIGAAVRPGVPLAYLVPTGGGCLVLLAYRRPDGEPAAEDLWVPELSTAAIDRLVIGGPTAERSFLWQQITGDPGFAAVLAGVLGEVGPRLAAPLAARLRELDATGVVLVPGGRLASLPLHAAPYGRDGETACLLDDFDVHYAPSAWVHADALSRAARLSAAPATLTGIADPTGDLRYARAELEDVAALFTGRGAPAPRTHYGERATKDALTGGLPATYVHLACHGRYTVTDPLESHLLLAGDVPLTLRELLDGRGFEGARLVVASACQTAVSELLFLPDEAVGLPAGFLRAGAAAVIGTLWPVDDVSTALLMTRFYQGHLDERLPVDRALRRAQRWLATVTAGELAEHFAAQASPPVDSGAGRRLPAELAAAGAIRFGFDDPDHRPFAEPYHWAPFVLMGA
ncbi:CHAT domain-containing protein, partial [Sphaerisporangium melleum]